VAEFIARRCCSPLGRVKVICNRGLHSKRTAPFYERLDDLIDTARRTTNTPLDTVRTILTRTATAFRDDTTIQAGARLQVERTYINAALPTPYTAFTTTLTDLLTQAHTTGQLRPDCNPQALAHTLTSAFFGAQHISWILHNRTDLPQRTHDILNTTLNPNQP
ncbi:hypothetical protein ACIQVK_49820, partial [Streptomyces sp. NPDC090493]|uniref:hypothetical protein n=1 Tax=Streptomyces sp. NPDC090493 TaxID=3365964 RepID=UPI00381215F5